MCVGGGGWGGGEGNILVICGGLRNWGGGIYLKIFKFPGDNGNKNSIPE